MACWDSRHSRSDFFFSSSNKEELRSSEKPSLAWLCSAVLQLLRNAFGVEERGQHPCIWGSWELKASALVFLLCFTESVDVRVKITGSADVAVANFCTCNIF